MIDLPGKFVPVASKFVREGDTVFLQHHAYAVIRRQAGSSQGSGLVLEDLQTHDRMQVARKPEETVYRLQLDQQHSGPAVGWTMLKGDVVVYPAKQRASTVAAIRHSGGWYATSGVRIPRPDVQILMDVMQGRALIVRNQSHQPSHTHTPILLMARSGSVVALRDATVSDPTAWVRTGPDLWRSSTGVEASDGMINYEMERRTYQFLWTPKH